MKKLWSVEVSDETLVYAETREEAEKLAARHWRDDPHPDFWGTECIDALPPGWDVDCVPYGAQETVEDILIRTGQKDFFINAAHDRANAAADYLKAHAKWVAEQSSTGEKP